MRVPLVHDERVADPRAAAALVRALGGERVRLTQHNARAWVIREPAAIARVLEAAEPATRTAIAFECITRDATLPALADLVAADSEYLHIAGTDRTLDVWPRRDEAFVGELRVGRATAFARFRAASTHAWIEGYVHEPGDAALAALRRALAEVDQPEVEVELELAVDAALALTLAHPAAPIEWTAGDVAIRFPDGTLSTLRPAPVPEELERAWRDRLCVALRGK